MTYGQNSSFLSNWTGRYSGKMIITFANRPNDTVYVEFIMEELIKDSLWTDQMHYHSEKYGKIKKDYLIRAVGKDNKTDFLLDEQNGIIMELTFMNDCFYGMYEVMGTIYTTTFRKQEDQLIFELFGASNESPTISETLPDENGDKVVVTSPKPTLVQSVILSRIK